MLRRAGAFHASFYAGVSPVAGDDDEALKLKWLKWAELESFKRYGHGAESLATPLTIHSTALRALINDVQSAVANMRSTTFSGTDIDFALPAAQDVWDAPNPQDWKIRMLAKEHLPEAKPLTLTDVIQDPWKLKTCGDRYDCVLSILAATYCLWPQIASFLNSRALEKFSRPPVRPSFGPMWLEAQRQDLHKRLSDMQDVAQFIGTSTADVYMVCELFSMSLYISPVDAQKFVGRCVG